MGAVGAGITAGADLLGGIISGAGSNAQRGWEAKMSNTAYQRASIDMQKAGLNPMMMFGKGGPESSPSGPNTTEAVGEAVSSAPSKALQTMVMQADTNAKNASAAQMRAETLNQAAIGNKLLAETKAIPVTADAAAAQSRAALSQASSASSVRGAEQDKLRYEIDHVLPQTVAESPQRVAASITQQDLNSAQADAVRSGLLSKITGTDFTDAIRAGWHKLLAGEHATSAVQLKGSSTLDMPPVGRR